MSRLLHAAARGARIEGLYQRGWIPVFAVRTDGLTDGQYKYRIHPDDEHLQYGPISTALREMAEDYSWNPSWEHYAAHAVEDRFTLFDRGHCEFDFPLFYLFLAEFLADEGM
jgi:hypothetical protein